VSPTLLHRLAARAAELPANDPDRALLLDAARALSPRAAVVPPPERSETRRRGPWAEDSALVEAGDVGDRAAFLPAVRR
jgi:hypothetical protein